MIKQNIGTLIEVRGPVISVQFDDNNVPNILNALEIRFDDKVIVCEVAQHLGDGKVSAISMDVTEGLYYGLEVVDTGDVLSVPIGDATKGRIITGSPDTEINGRPVARVGDCVETDCGHKDYIITGSGTVEVNGKLEARVDDQVGRDGIYKARIISGSDDTEHNE